MAGFNAKEAWRQIPVEEKLELMATAQAKGVAVSFFFILILSTLAVGFQFDQLMWFSLLATPVVFQVTTGMRWRAMRPILIMQYLAARSAARRYAYNSNSADMGLRLIFRGEMEPVFDEDDALGALDAAITTNQAAEVWIALFNDAVIVLSERHGGAELEFGYIINDKLSITPTDPEADDYSNDRELVLALDDAEYGNLRMKLRSRHSAAMVVFERQLNQLIQIPRIERIEGIEEDEYDE